MHIIQIVRHYLGFSQHELAERAGISQPDLCDMEIKAPYGHIDKYQRLSSYLGIPVHALVTNNCTLIPLSFYDKHSPAPYTKSCSGSLQELGRRGEDKAFMLEKEKLALTYPNLSRLVLPLYKLRCRAGFDILSFDNAGKPISIEVKTTLDDNPDCVLTKQEYLTAVKLVSAGETYQIYRFTNWGCDNQSLAVYDFKELQESHDVVPSTYLCSSAPREPVISGITYWREKRGLSKGELADYLGIKTSHLWRYETEKRRCSVGVYHKLSQILDVDIDCLLKEYATS